METGGCMSPRVWPSAEEKKGGGVQRRFDQAKGQRGNTSRWPLEAAGSEEGKQAIDSLGLRRLGRSDCRQQIAGAAAGEYRESASPCTMSDGGRGGVLVSLSCIYSWMSCYCCIHVHDLSLFFWYQPLFPVPLANAATPPSACALQYPSCSI